MDYRQVLSAIWMTNTWVYVGCGIGGLTDPDFDLLFQPNAEHARQAKRWDFCLVRRDQLEIFNKEFERLKLNIRAISYGQEFSKLPAYLRSLLKESLPAEISNWPDAARDALNREFPIPKTNSAPDFESPFPGLDHFSESDALLFFGRTDETQKLCCAVKEFPLVLVFGESGVGKSSLLRAGLMPRDVGTPLNYVSIDKMVRYLDQMKLLLETTSNQPTVLVLDQLEAFYTDKRDNGGSDADHFWVALHAAMSGSEHLRVVLSFRKEYYVNIRDSLIERGFSWIPEQEIRVLSLDRRGIIEAIQGVAKDPALKNIFRLTVEDDMAEALAYDLLNERTPESPVGPLLQYQLRKLWDDAIHRRSNESENIVFTKDRYLDLRFRTLDALLDDQLAAVASEWKKDVDSGLVLDLLHRYTTDLPAAKAENDSDVLEHYNHIKHFRSLFYHLKHNLRILIPCDTDDRKATRLAHDCLAPVIRRRFGRSDAPGQRAARLLAAKTGQEQVTFSESDVATVKEGQLAMTKVEPDTMASVERDNTIHRTRRRRQINDLITRAIDRLEHLDLDKCLRLLQDATVVGAPHDRVSAVARELTYPLTRLGKNADLEAAVKLLRYGKSANPPELSRGERYFPVLIDINGGNFEMGGNDKHAYNDEKPVHKVRLSSFKMSETPITWWQYGLYCLMTHQRLPNDAGFGRGKRPVINVKWIAAVEYCNWLTKIVSELNGTELKEVYQINDKTVTADFAQSGFRLPTEAEWEYAAREGGKCCLFGNGMDIATDQLMNFDAEHELNERTPEFWKKGYARDMTTRVKVLKPNSLGLYDMSGNVFEWCWDWWSDGAVPNYKTEDVAIDPEGPTTRPKDEQRVIRGGSWQNVARLCRCTYRWRFNPAHRFNTLGFRVVRRE